MAKRYTIHPIRDPDYGSISAAPLQEADTIEQAKETAAEIGHLVYFGVAIYDHETDTIDFGTETKGRAAVQFIE